MIKSKKTYKLGLHLVSFDRLPKVAILGTERVFCSIYYVCELDQYTLNKDAYIDVL